jgi:8-oxo-dGTP pyrophosphatase MutT (NUDIX family)
MPIDSSARWTPHVTVAAIIERDGRFLLVEEHSADGLRLNNPAGHLEPGESLVQACARETLEETTYAFTPSALLGVYLSQTTKGVSYLRFAFCGDLGVADATRALDTGIERTLWLSADEVKSSQDRHRSPMVLQCMGDYLNGQRFGLELIHTHPSQLAGKIRP